MANISPAELPERTSNGLATPAWAAWGWWRAAAVLVLAAALGSRAGPVEDAIIAAMKLVDQPSYSWTCTIADDAQTYAIEGKTIKGGCTWQRQPMPETIARRLGRGAGRELEAIFSAPLRYVVRTEEGWKSPDELPKQHADWNDGSGWYYIVPPIGRTPDMPADERDIDPFGLPPAVYIPLLKDQDGPDGRPYSNAQFALALPHEELATIVSSHDELHVDGDVAAGTLTDLGARLLLVHDGHEYIHPVIATGRFKLWMNTGRVEKYTVELAGIIMFEEKPVYVRQKSTTELKDIGATTVEIPDDAKRRLHR